MKSRKLVTTLVASLFVATFCFAESTESVEGAEDSSAESQDKVDVLFAGGVVISPGYQDFIDDVYESAGYDTAGGSGWVDLYVGIEYKLEPQISLIGGCDFLINAVDVTGGPLNETYANTIFIPSLYGQLYLDEARMFYVNAGVLLPMASSGSDYFEFEGDGLGFGAHIGLAFADGIIRLEGGYVHIPVTVDATPSNPTLAGSGDYNFGGPQIRLVIGL